MNIIYEPQGRAAEYSPLAANLYSGCGHGCEYCYAPAALKRTREQFAKVAPRKDVVRLLEKDARSIAGDKRQILLCFTCDPYQQIDQEHQLTRQALEIFRRHNLSCAILTKGGKRSERDFDIMQQFQREQFKYGATLVFAGDEEALKREPGAAPTSERIESLKKAHDLGIRTWVSLEPVYDSQDAYRLIESTKDFVDLYKVGKLNYRPEAKAVNWQMFAIKVKAQLENLGKEYYIKKDLVKYIQ